MFAAIRRAALLAVVGLYLNPLILSGRAQQPSDRNVAPAAIHGVIRDPLGAVVTGATVELLGANIVVGVTTSGPDGAFTITPPEPGRYYLRVAATSFQTTDILLLPSIDQQHISDIVITLATPTFTQQITVTAAGTPLPEAQTGAAITVLPADTFQFMAEVQDPLRLVPGLQMTQVGEIGGTSGLSIRGATTDANKVLIDGVPANAIGGAVEFANLANVGVQSIEVLREPNSALYGSDALAGVVNITSSRGSTALPLFTYAGDAGNFGSYHNELSAGTKYKETDLYSAFARFDTENNVPNSEFHNSTYVGNFGWTPNSATDLRFTVRHLVQAEGQPNAILLYGIPDDGQQREQDNYYSAVWNNQTTQAWHNQVRYGSLRQRGLFTEFGATGIPDPNSPGYFDGAPVTIRGGNGYAVSGQAQFQYSSTLSQSTSTTNRDFIYAESDYRIGRHTLALGGFKYEHESGTSSSTGEATAAIQRGNYSYTSELTGDIRNRLFYTVGTGLEDNGLFGFAATPRVALAYYLFHPTASGLLNGTKLHGTFGKGIKEPSVYDQTNSLHALDQNFSPLGAEYSRTFDGGIDQQFFKGRARIGMTYFHNEFTNAVEYVPPSGLIELGISAVNNPQVNEIGAYINSMAFRSQGIEFESEYRLTDHIFIRAGYTYTDAVVQRSFSTDNLNPSFNTSSNFSSIPIGAFSPLAGARPFRVAPHTGYFAINYTPKKFYLTLSGTLVGSRNDSDFLCDNTISYGCGTSLLLPNRNLDAPYQRIDFGGGYQINSRMSVDASLQNLLSEHYQEAFGYPDLPFTFRTGLKLNFGGESWKLK